MASEPTLPTFAALVTEPMPSTIVQKMIGLIIILIRLTNPVPSGFSSLPSPATPGRRGCRAATATTTAI